MRPKPKHTLGPDVIAFIEALCVHGPGDILGQPARLTAEEKRFLLWAYEVDDEGKRIVRRGVRGLPKGSRKTEWAAWVAIAEMCGPVRFSHWDEDGQARGRPVVDPYVVCGAASIARRTPCVSQGAKPRISGPYFGTDYSWRQLLVPLDFRPTLLCP